MAQEERIKVKIKKMTEDAVLPSYAHDGDACMDLTATHMEYNAEKDYYVYHTGLKIELPEGTKLSIKPRSSNRDTDCYIPNTPGTVDAPYRGEILVIFKPRTSIKNKVLLHVLKDIVGMKRKKAKWHLFQNYSDDAIYKYAMENAPYKVGERIAQCEVVNVTKVDWEEVTEELSETDRGEGGFGSSN